MTVLMDSYADRCNEATFRISKIIHVAASGLGDALTDEMSEIAEDNPDLVIPGWSEVVAKAQDDGYYDAREAEEEFGSEALMRQDSRLGFLVLAEHPSWDQYPMFSWGIYTAEWFYGETYDEAFIAAESWARAAYDSAVEADRKKKGKK